MRNKYFFIGLSILITLVIGFICIYIVPFLIHLQIVENSKNYQPETFISFDNKYILQTLKYEDESGAYANFAIQYFDTEESVFLCPDKYRTMDLKSIAWDEASYTVIVVSADVGTIYYCFVDNLWIKSSGRSIDWSVSKYSEITSKHYEVTLSGYNAAFYKKSEIDAERIVTWLDSCEPSEGYYQFIYSDPDSWDMFIYYSPEHGLFSNDGFRFFMDGSGSILHIFVTNNESDETDDYMLIRIQAPLRGAWPNSSMLYLDSISIEMQDTSWAN